MRVSVHRECYLRVAEHIHHHSWRHSLNQQEGGARVAQVMEPPLHNSSAIELAVEVVTDNCPIKRSSCLSCENEVGGLPTFASDDPLFQLAIPVFAKADND